MSSSCMDGLLLVNKKSGLTSFDSLKDIKKAFATGKAGHTGTLDKFASGLLLVLIGRGLKLVPLFNDHVKEYRGKIFFGKETDTLDPEGSVVAEGLIPSREEVEAALASFRGDILQAPPAYSALHIDGKRAHELAREGKTPEMKKRPVTVHELKLLSWTPPEAEIFARVSAGTYIRSLARDIALKAGSRAYLSALKRTKVGEFSLEDVIEDSGSGDELVNALRPLDRRLIDDLCLPSFFLGEGASKDFMHGKPLSGILSGGEFFLPGANIASQAAPDGEASAAVFAGKNDARLIGIIKHTNNKWGYAHVFADS